MKYCLINTENFFFKATVFIFGSFLFLATIILFLSQKASAQCSIEFQLGEEIYYNPLANNKNAGAFIIESQAKDQPEVTFQNGKMQLQSDSHFLMWIPETFPDSIAVSWDFLPKNDNGLAMFWFCAQGRNGEDLFDKSLKKRTGDYPQYHSGDINAYHVAYFRRNPWDNPAINTVNLRKSFGNILVTQGPNPIPNIDSEKVKKKLNKPYRIMVIKCGKYIRMKINDLLIFDWVDEKPYATGKIGFRQMANLMAEYSNLRVQKVIKIEYNNYKNNF